MLSSPKHGCKLSKSVSYTNNFANYNASNPISVGFTNFLSRSSQASFLKISPSSESFCVKRNIKYISFLFNTFRIVCYKIYKLSSLGFSIVSPNEL